MTENLAVIQEIIGRLVSPKVDKKVINVRECYSKCKKNEVVPQGKSLLDALNVCQINVERK